MPNQFIPINTSDQKAALNQINNNFRKLDAASVTQSFGGQNSPDKLLIGKTGDETLGMSYKKDDADKIVFGKLPDGTYGLIFYDNAGLPSIYMVIDTNGKPVLKVAKTGKNAQTGVDSDMIFNSAQNIFKIVYTDTLVLGTVAAPSAGNFNQTTFTKTSTFKSTLPVAFDAYVIVGVNTAWKMPFSNTAAYPSNNIGGFAELYEPFTSIDSNGFVVFNVSVRNFGIFPTTGYTVKFYLFSENAN